MNFIERGKKRVLKRSRRIIFMGILFSICFFIIALKAFYLQTLQEDVLSRRALKEYRRAGRSMAKRGAIYDAKMRELAVSTGVVAIGAHPKQIVKPKMTAALIAKTLKVSNSKIMGKMLSHKSFVWITRDASPDRAAVLKKAVADGLEFYPSYTRIYPNKTLAAQVIGITGLNEKALEGLEFYYDDYLKGNARKWTYIRDAIGRIYMRTEESRDGGEGKNLVLTIDGNIQYIVEQAIKKAVNRFNARSAMAIVMTPASGAILALANYPLFNPNSYNRFPREIWRNRAVTDPFEPGSTMKVFLAAAALESGKCTPETIVDCENGKYTIFDKVIHDTHPHGLLSLFEVVKYSSNIGAAKIAEIIGPKALYDTLTDCGFGEKTGIDAPGETSGMLRNYLAWQPIDNATIAFGQGISVSALQLITGVCAVANDGLLVQPRIVDRITNADGTVLKKYAPRVVRRAFSQSVARNVREMMRAVTMPDGTGPQAVPKGYTVCGKTGTAQIINSRGTYEHCDYNALFVGFSPARNPKLAVLVVVNAPQGSHYGGVVAAPAFREILRKSFNYLNIPPERQVEEKNEKKGQAGSSVGEGK
ncbi:MAG: penicillin-binding protein 2 [Deltaproteobacteria bacterium]|nr:penicillin-binding protein 2 [Deltaproteobacteria bacterium]